MISNASVLFRGDRQQLPDLSEQSDPVTVPASQLAIEFEGTDLPTHVTLDGLPVSIAVNEGRTRGHLFVDAHRSVGFHALEAGSKRFLFGTEDAKLGMRGVLKMLRRLERDGLSWGTQLFFSDGSVIRDAKVDYAWLTTTGRDIISIAQQIAEQPDRRVRSSPRLSRPRAGRLLRSQTLALLRSNMSTLLEESANGPIALQGSRYAPVSVILSRPELTVDTVANRRTTWTLLECQRLAGRLHEAGEIPRRARKTAGEIYRRVSGVLAQHPFAKLSRGPLRFSTHPTPRELSDDRYIRMFDYWDELRGPLAWEPGLRIAPRFAYVAYSDQLFQAYCAVMLSDALGAVQQGPFLQPGSDKPSFSSDTTEVYYDTSPPQSTFLNWRDASCRPTEMRPDLTLIDVERKQGILMDAKYRVKGSRVTPDAINECQVYMQAFARKHIAVCYPGEDLQLEEISGQGNVILAVPMAPVDGLRDFLREVAVPRLQQLMEPLDEAKPAA